MSWKWDSAICFLGPSLKLWSLKTSPGKLWSRSQVEFWFRGTRSGVKSACLRSSFKLCREVRVKVLLVESKSRLITWLSSQASKLQVRTGQSTNTNQSWVSIFSPHSTWWCHWRNVDTFILRDAPVRGLYLWEDSTCERTLPVRGLYLWEDSTCERTPPVRGLYLWEDSTCERTFYWYFWIITSC